MRPTMVGRSRRDRRIRYAYPVERVPRVCHSHRRYVTIFSPEIDAAEGEVIARFEDRQSDRSFFPAHMTRLAASVRVIGTKTDDVSATNRNDRHATDCDKCHEASQSAFSFHAPYCTPLPFCGQYGKIADGWSGRPRSFQPKGADFRTRARARCRRRSSTNDRRSGPRWRCRRGQRPAYCRRTSSRYRQCSP